MTGVLCVPMLSTCYRLKLATDPLCTQSRAGQSAALPEAPGDGLSRLGQAAGLTIENLAPDEDATGDRLRVKFDIALESPGFAGSSGQEAS